MRRLQEEHHHINTYGVTVRQHRVFAGWFLELTALQWLIRTCVPNTNAGQSGDASRNLFATETPFNFSAHIPKVVKIKMLHFTGKIQATPGSQV